MKPGTGFGIVHRRSITSTASCDSAAVVVVRDLGEAIRAITTRMDPARDTMVVEHTPIDYLGFASPP